MTEKRTVYVLYECFKAPMGVYSSEGEAEKAMEAAGKTWSECSVKAVVVDAPPTREGL